MILSALLTQVKTELRINDTDRDTWIKSLFVEILGDFHGNWTLRGIVCSECHGHA
jgi:hypothetical protein